LIFFVNILEIYKLSMPIPFNLTETNFDMIVATFYLLYHQPNLMKKKDLH